MTLAGLGTGMVENTPYIAIQAVMERYVVTEISYSNISEFRCHANPQYEVTTDLADTF